MELLLNFWNVILRWFDVIPKLTYFILVCFMSVIDVMQFVFRKLVGLDVYYLGESNSPQTGDIALAFLRSIFDKETQFPAIKNAFWALVILGIILLILTTIIAIIRQEYMPGQEETKAKDKNNKIFILTRSVKSLFLFIIVPVSAIFGLMLGDIFLQAIDKATSSSGTSSLFSNSSVTSKLESVEVNGVTSYSFYDIFGGSLPTNSTSFSGIMFKASAYTSNRIRLGETYKVSTGVAVEDESEETDEVGFEENEEVPSETTTEQTFYYLIKYDYLSNFDIFNTASDESEMADMIDDAFANNIRFTANSENILILGPMKDQLDTDLWGIKGEYNVTNFSKFNVSLVWYYYNLWFFNYIIGFAFFIIAGQLFVNLAMGLAKRLFEIVALFIISPPIVAIMPLDEGKAFQNWRKAFIGRAVSAYGVILGFNVIFLIMPYIQQIHIFPSGNFGYQLINILVSTVFAILCLQMVQTFMAMLSKMIGADDMAASGQKMVEQVGATIKEAGMYAGAAAGLAMGAFGAAGKIAGGVGKAAAKYVKDKAREKETPAQKKAREAKEEQKAAKKQARKDKVDKFKGGISNAYNAVMGVGFGKKAAENEASNEWERGGADKAFDEMMGQDEDYQKVMDDEYTKYQEKNGDKSREEWQKSSDSKDARAKAESKFANKKGMDRAQYKADANIKKDFVNERVNEKRKKLVTARQSRIANALITQTGLKNTATVGEMFTEELKDMYVRGGAKGGFPAMTTMINGGDAGEVKMAAIKKKNQKQQMMTTSTQMDVQKEFEEKEKKKKGN